jgi:hypothetical protein
MATPGDIPTPSVPAPPRPGGLPTRDPTAYPTAGERYGVSAPAGPSFEERPSGTSGPLSRPPLMGALHIPGASALYATLGLLLLVAGVLALVMPGRLSAVFFRGERAYWEAPLFEELWRLLGATFLAASIVAYALKISADRAMMNDPVVQRLQLGFFWFALLAVILHLVHLFWTKSLTIWGLVLGAAVMAPTLLVPTAHLGVSGGFGLAVAADSFTGSLGNVFYPRRVTAAGLLYSLLTVLFVVAGVGYVAVPRRSLRWALGYTGVPKAAVFLWQWIGAGALFLFPAVTYTCLERAAQGALWGSVPKVLNVALLVAALLHVLEFGAAWATEGAGGRWALPVLTVHWAATLGAAILGLGSAGEPPAPAYAYEPLAAQA